LPKLTLERPVTKGEDISDIKASGGRGEKKSWNGMDTGERRSSRQGRGVEMFHGLGDFGEKMAERKRCGKPCGSCAIERGVAEPFRGLAADQWVDAGRARPSVGFGGREANFATKR